MEPLLNNICEPSVPVVTPVKSEGPPDDVGVGLLPFDDEGAAEDVLSDAPAPLVDPELVSDVLSFFVPKL